MQKKQKSSIWAKLKYAIAVVGLLGFISLVDACKANNALSKAKEVKELKTEKVKDACVFQEIDVPPIFPGCENLKPEEVKKCFSKKISQFVGENFNTKVAKIPDSSGKVKILMHFTVDKSGKVTGIKAHAKQKAFEEEAKRVLKALPQMTPGKAKGQAVNVCFTIPVIFKAEK